MDILWTRIQDWMVTYKTISVKATTYDRLVTSLETLKQYPLAFMDIKTIESTDLQKYINDMANDGYALSTVKKQYHLVTAYMKYAVAEGEMPRPIYNNVHLPTRQAVKKKEREIHGYTPPEQAALNRVLQTQARPAYAAAMLMMETGMRVGECLALTWDDVLWRHKALRINKTLIRISNRRRSEVQDGAKSFSSNRTIPLSKNAYNLLTDLYNKGGCERTYIFDAGDGKPMSYEAMRWQIQRACEEAGVDYLGQHVFRHTFATNCYNRGCDVKILSKLLGHAEVSVTYNVYIHLFGDALEEMRNVVG